MGLLTDLFVVFVGDLGMKKGLSNDSPKTGAPEGTRTPDLLVRSQSLYPAELLAHSTLIL